MDRKKLAQIHIIKKELNLSDAQYRDILQRTTHVRTAKDLTNSQFNQLMSYFLRYMYQRMNADTLTSNQKMYIKQLIRDLEWSDEHCENFLRKYYHKTRLDMLTKREAIKVIESLKNIKTHQK